MNENSGNSSGGYESLGQLPIELPLLQHAQNNNNNNNINGTIANHAANCFYPAASYYTDPNTPSTASSGPYSSLLPGYNPYATITPPFEFIFQGYPWHFAAVDLSGEVPLQGLDQHTSATTAPLLSQTFSPLHSINSTATSAAAAAVMTRYGSRSNAQNPRRGGRRPREEYEVPVNDEDKEKRDKRRQRNKEAAARCRQRRLDLMQQLQEQKDVLEQRNNQIATQYSTLRKGVEDVLQSLRTHTNNCQIRDDLMRQLDVVSNTLRNHQFQIGAQQMHPSNNNNSSNNGLTNTFPPVSLPSSGKRKKAGNNDNLLAAQMHNSLMQPQEQRVPRPTTLQLNNKLELKNDLISPGSSSFDDNSLTFDSPDIKRNKFGDDSPLERERPQTLSLSTFNWGQTPSIVTPSNGMPQISEFVKNNFPDEYNMFNQQTFLTPVAPAAISVTSSAAPPQTDDLQTL